MYMYIYICIYMCVYLCIHIYIQVYIQVYIYIYIYTYIGLVSAAVLPPTSRLRHEETIFSCDLSNTIMERVPRIGASVYRQQEAVVARASAEPVPALSSRVACHGACRVASSCGYSACSAHGTFCTSHVQPGPGCSAVSGINGCRDMVQQQGSHRVGDKQRS